MVGVSGTSVAEPGRGFLFEHGAMLDLNALIDPGSGWTIGQAAGINDAQQIAVRGCLSGQCYAVRLDLIAAVPEAGSWSMPVAGLGLICWRLRRTVYLRTSAATGSMPAFRERGPRFTGVPVWPT